MFFIQIFFIDDYIIYEQRLLFLISLQSFIFYFHYLSDSSVGKESACKAGDVGSTPGLERSPEKGKGYPLQYSGLETSMHSPWGHKESDTTEQLSLSITCLIALAQESTTELKMSDKKGHLCLVSECESFDFLIIKCGIRCGFLTGIFIKLRKSPSIPSLLKVR